jgi:hypothetical protein
MARVFGSRMTMADLYKQADQLYDLLEKAYEQETDANPSLRAAASDLLRSR